MRRMRHELESDIRERYGGGLGGLGRQTQSHGDNIATWRRGRLDIVGTKQVARHCENGGPQRFVTVLVEKMLGKIHSEDVVRATEMVFRLLHIALVCCNLALPVHTLPRCLAG